MVSIRKLDLSEAKNRLFELIEQVEQGDEIVLMRGEEPVARLVAAEKKRIRRFGSAKGLIELSNDFDEPLEDFEDSM